MSFLSALRGSVIQREPKNHQYDNSSDKNSRLISLQLFEEIWG